MSNIRSKTQKPKTEMQCVIKYNTIFYYSESDQSYVTSVPRLPGCMSDSKTIEEAIANTQKIIEEWIQNAREDGEDVPEPDSDELILTRCSIMDVAKWFIDKNGGEIGSKKLQKLCYYAQAWSYAIRDKALFAGDFQAWVHGPVNRELWDIFKNIAYRNIKTQDFKDYSIKTNLFSPEEEAFLDRVWVTYGEFEGFQLEELARQEKPWLEQREGLDERQSSQRIINPTTMAEYYRDLYIEIEEENT